MRDGEVKETNGRVVMWWGDTGSTWEEGLGFGDGGGLGEAGNACAFIDAQAPCQVNCPTSANWFIFQTTSRILYFFIRHVTLTGERFHNEPFVAHESMIKLSKPVDLNLWANNFFLNCPGSAKSQGNICPEI